MLSTFCVVLGLAAGALAVDGQDGCLFNGRVYAAGQTFTIPPCLANMTCLGHNSYTTTSLNGDCGTKRNIDNSQTGCLFDGTMYSPGDKFIIPNCLAEMTCLGDNNYAEKQLGGQCPDKRDVDEQSMTGCYFNDCLYNYGEKFIIPTCLAEMKCLGNNNFESKPLGGVCPDKRAVDGQTGCDYDGKILAPEETIIIQPCLARLTCKGHNNYDSVPLFGQC